MLLLSCVLTTLLDGGCQGFLYRPALFTDAGIKSCRFDPCSFCPFGDAQVFTVEVQQVVVAPISAVLAMSYPATGRRTVAFAVAQFVLV